MKYLIVVCFLFLSYCGNNKKQGSSEETAVYTNSQPHPKASYNITPFYIFWLLNTSITALLY